MSVSPSRRELLGALGVGATALALAKDALSHWENNYGGAVKALNAVEQRLDGMLKDKGHAQRDRPRLGRDPLVGPARRAAGAHQTGIPRTGTENYGGPVVNTW